MHELEEATLTCPGYDRNINSTNYMLRWYKVRGNGQGVQRVAYYHVQDGNAVSANVTEGDLEGRAWMSRINGQLTITSLRSSDSQLYVCNHSDYHVVIVRLTVIGE